MGTAEPAVADADVSGGSVLTTAGSTSAENRAQFGCARPGRGIGCEAAVQRRTHLCITGWRRHQARERRRLGGVSLHQLGILALIIAPIRVPSGEQLVENQSAGENVRRQSWHLTASKVLRRAIIVASDISLMAMPRRAAVGQQGKIHINKL